MIYKARLETRLRTRTQNGERDEIVHTVQAMVALRDDGSWSLRYHDDENRGQTALQGTREWMTLSREGTVRSKMRFALDQLLPALYVTPLGEFDMATRTDHYTYAVTDHDGRLSLHYDLLMSGELAAQNHLEVKWHRM